MRLDLDDFSVFHEPDPKKDDKNIDHKSAQEVERYYQEKILQLEQEYKELLNKVSKESYDQGFEDASNSLKKEFEQKLQEFQKSMQEQKEKELAQLQEKYLGFEKEYEEKYNNFLMKFSDIVLDSTEEILEFLFIDESNTPTVQSAIAKLLEDFHNFMPLSISVSKGLYKPIKKRFQNVEIKQDDELKDNEFVIEFHDFKIENRIKEKIGVIKDEIKREIKKLT
ncbi:hypothetical protein [Nitratiruptor sp. YY09-18]|uniref:hypothetical protein n=1 Tax=Nitratiruptor sp. YY09-18 TaxID=2724901 RepID=UPI001915CA4E|nr:hypothetical protein [Nitratiruptor sp. YY09-18]BCD68385.1 hypothetical protein NitYY0918_C1300 [Nitratiruptor sp. YY09-18]